MKPYLTQAEAARVLRVTVDAIKWRRGTGTLPFVRGTIAGHSCVLISRAALVAFLLSAPLTLNHNPGARLGCSAPLAPGEEVA